MRKRILSSIFTAVTIISVLLLTACGAKTETEAKQPAEDSTKQSAENEAAAECMHEFEKVIGWTGKDATGEINYERYTYRCTKCGCDITETENAQITAIAGISLWGDGYLKAGDLIYSFNEVVAKPGEDEYKNVTISYPAGVNTSIIAPICSYLLGDYTIKECDNPLLSGEIICHSEIVQTKRIEERKQLTIEKSLYSCFYEISCNGKTVKIPAYLAAISEDGNHISNDGSEINVQYPFESFCYDGIEYRCLGEGGAGMNLSDVNIILERLGFSNTVDAEDIGSDYKMTLVIK